MLTKKQFDEQTQRVDDIILGPVHDGVRNYHEGEFFKTWRYSGLRDVKDQCPDREARSMMRQWYTKRFYTVWEQLGFEPVPDEWNYHTAPNN